MVKQWLVERRLAMKDDQEALWAMFVSLLLWFLLVAYRFGPSLALFSSLLSIIA